MSCRQGREICADWVALCVVVQVVVQNAVVDGQNRGRLITLGPTRVGGGPTIGILRPPHPVITPVHNSIDTRRGERAERRRLGEGVQSLERVCLAPDGLRPPRPWIRAPRDPRTAGTARCRRPCAPQRAGASDKARRDQAREYQESPHQRRCLIPCAAHPRRRAGSELRLAAHADGAGIRPLPGHSNDATWRLRAPLEPRPHSADQRSPEASCLELACERSAC